MFKKVISIFLFLSINLACSQQPPRQLIQTDLNNLAFKAKVIRIIDGDTMEVLYQNNPIKIRLEHIDCPEKRGSQPFGNNAKIALSALCFGQQVTVYGGKHDRYKRLLAVIVNDKKENVNQEMIKQGMAWHYKKFSRDPIYAQLEITARNKKIGLWQDANPTPPWDWRKTKHGPSKSKNTRSAPNDAI